MRKLTLLITGLLLVAVGCGSSGDGASDATTTTAAKATTSTTTADEEPTDLEVETVTTTEPSGDAEAPADGPTGQILMIKLPVGDGAKALEFYQNVFGATLSMQMGEGIQIVSFAEGPGLVLISSGADPGDAGDADGESSGHGAFIIKVPDMEAAKALALENGATEQKTFTGDPNGQAATSVDLLDPWGNQVEILQLG